jgi:valyl-tRNA synthetase
MIDFSAEIARLEKERAKMISEIERIDKKLGNAGFVAKAPAAVIEGERKKREGYESKLHTIEESIAKYKA